MKRITVLAFACILSLSVSVAEAADTIVAFGDSITVGKGSTPYSSFLQQKINGKATVVNRGKSGEQTGGGVSRISSVLAADKPTYILIMEGANDAIWGISSSTVKYNIGVMIDKSIAAGATPIVGNVTPNTRHELTATIRNNYNPAIASIAAAKGVVLVDAFGAVVDDWEKLNFDGLHLTAEGESILADQFYAALPYSSSDGGGGGCFIATAAFGSGMADKVVLLKDFRDRFLLTNGPGTSFVKLYYQYSPPVARFIAQHDSLRAVVRILLYPFVFFAYVMLHTGWAVRLVLVACVALSVAWTVGGNFRSRGKKTA